MTPVICSRCHASIERDQATVLIYVFKTADWPPKQVRSRTMARLCPTCRDAEPAWSRDAFSEAPGYNDRKDNDGDNGVRKIEAEAT